MTAQRVANGVVWFAFAAAIVLATAQVVLDELPDPGFHLGIERRADKIILAEPTRKPGGPWRASSLGCVGRLLSRFSAPAPPPGA